MIKGGKIKFIKLKWSLNLQQTLLGGQSFRWSQLNDSDFLGVFANIVWKLSLDTEGQKLYYEVLGELPYPENEANRARIKASAPQKSSKPEKLYTESYYQQLLTNYFRLDSDLENDYSFWIDAHKHFESKASRDSTLVTQLDQDVVETTFSFICSQNNHITRISKLVEKLCTNYGDKICTIGEKDYFNFPSLDRLTDDNQLEEKLRQEGFGYRAKYIDKAAKEITAQGGAGWLSSLTKMTYHDAHDSLMKIPGIGPKVADCICLMALNFLDAIPVDTHVIQIARHYLQNDEDIKKAKTLNMKQYRKIGDTFRSVYGSKAGVAQTVLFCKELSRFAEESKAPQKKKSRK